jgi:uncharacterized membrane protein
MIIYRLKEIGKKPLCNLKEERAPRLGDFCFPLCWRCTSTIVSALFFKYIIINFIQFTYPYHVVLFGIFFLVPLIVDGINQYLFKKCSSNNKRISTGILAGIGICLITI